MRYHLTSVRMAIIQKKHKKNKKNLQIINPGEYVEKRESSCIVGGNVDIATVENGMEMR